VVGRASLVVEPPWATRRRFPADNNGNQRPIRTHLSSSGGRPPQAKKTPNALFTQQRSSVSPDRRRGGLLGSAGHVLHGLVDPLATFNVLQVQPTPDNAVVANAEDGDPAHLLDSRPPRRSRNPPLNRWHRPNPLIAPTSP
jgi:hypothetical protein